MTNHTKIKEEIAQFYEQHHSRRKYEHLYGDEERMTTLVRLIGKGQRILDVGCRAGNLTKFYYQWNSVVGVDVDRNALELFEHRLGLKGIWLDIDYEPLPFLADSFDVVVFTEVMEHLRFPCKALAEIRRVLKPKGRLIGSVPNAFRLRNRWRFLCGRPYDPDRSHLRSFSPQTLRDVLSEYFQLVRILPASGHLFGGGKYGVPVFQWLPQKVRLLFCLDLVFLASGKRDV